MTSHAFRLRRWLVAVVAVAVTVMTAGLVAASLVRSPAQVAADTAPPPNTMLTAVVERRVLKETVVLRGSVAPGRSVEVTPSSAQGSDRLVVTGVRVKQGDLVDAGRVLIVVSGRPLTVLHGATPGYRDLRPGADGDDVKQLQAALKELGFTSSDRAGYFGSATKRAVTNLYAGLGFAPPTTGPTDDEAVVAANRRVRDAQAALDEALAAPGTPEPQLRSLRDNLTDARAERDRLVARTGVMVPLSEVVFLPAFPARVTKLAAAVGDDVRPPLVTLASGDLVVTAELNPGDRSQVQPGQPAEIYVDGPGTTIAGTLAAVGELTEGADGAGRHHPLTVTAALVPALAGRDVRLTIVIAATAQAVLVVPLSAVYAGADARTSVTRHVDGRRERLFVDVGATGDGFVEVTPVGGVLVAGDEVVVGVRR